MIRSSEYLSFRLLNPAPPKPTNIRVVEVTPTHIQFEGELTNPANSWRIYRSDGLFMRYDGQGSKMMIGIQPNEDVNGRSFSYRFMEVSYHLWGNTYSPLSDPITLAFAPLGAPSGKCLKRPVQTSFTCEVTPNNQANGTLIEFLDGDGLVVASRDTKRWTSQKFNFTKVKGAQSVRFTSTSGDIPYWYRRGDSVTVPLIKRYGFSNNSFTYAQ